MATVNKPIKKSKKAEKAEVQLVTPRPLSNIRQVTDLELFRLTYDGKPYVGLRVGEELMLFDKRGDMSRLSLAKGASDILQFIDYLTVDEGVEIPGSMEERVDPPAIAPTLKDALPIPSPREAIDQIPDGLTYQIVAPNSYFGGSKPVTWDARNFTSSNGSRVTLLFNLNTDKQENREHQHMKCGNNGEGWVFTEYVDEIDATRWDTHRLRKTFGITI